MNNDKKYLESGYDECNIHGICSISPTLFAIKGAVFAYLKEMAFYIIELHKLGATNEQIKNDFIDFFSILISNSEYTEESLHKNITQLQKDLHDIKDVYKNLCEQKECQTNFVSTQIKLKPDFIIADIMQQGKKYYDQFTGKFSEEQRKGIESISVILQSICLYIIELQSLEENIDKYYEELLIAFASRELHKRTIEQIKEQINYYAKLDSELMELLFEARIKTFGELIETEISLTPKEGKAILVAGANLKELELLLEATKDIGINVYTHGQMIAGHTFEKLKAYPHLAGHYGKGAEYYISDFSSFPGPILLTRVFASRVENLFHSRLFTCNNVIPKNTTQIVDYNFEPIIQAAQRMEGFSNNVVEKKISVGLFEQEFNDKINSIKEKIEQGEIKHVITIGVSNQTSAQLDYFKKFFTLLKDDCYVLSANYSGDFKNLLHKNVDYNSPLLNKMLNILLPLKENYNVKFTNMITRCEPHTIPSIINLRQLGIDNIYFHQCSPLLINPSLLDLVLDWYNIKLLTTPENDLRKIIGN